MFGLCTLSVAPLRAEPSDRSEMVSQLLFGEGYKIVEKTPDARYLRIETEHDGYLGWLDAKQHTEISGEYFEQLRMSPLVLTADLTSEILCKEKRLPVLAGSRLPFFDNGYFSITDIHYRLEGDVIQPSKKSKTREKILQTASLYLGAPYLWGGRTPFGIDCSGFVQQVFRFCGHNLKRDAYMQAEEGVEVPFQDLQRADVLFFENNDGKIVHVGIAAGEGNIIHASGEVRIDCIDEEGIFHEKLNTHTHRLKSIKRIFSTDASYDG